MKLKKLFVFLLVINTFVLTLVVFIVSDYNSATKELEEAYKTQHRLFILADELRQSSDDLTRVARTYVITGDPMYEEQFRTILAIRNGELPRPSKYNGIYWDFLTLKGSKPNLDGQKVSLRQLMKEAGFLDDELALLYESQKESDDLTNLENKAMNAIKGIFQDKEGNYTKRGQPDFKLAREIMHSDEYHKAKISIMKPIDEFYQAFEKRTQRIIEVAHARVKTLENYVGYSIIILIILVLFTFYTFISRILNPLEVIKNIMLRLSKNDMDVYIPRNYNIDEVGELIGAAEVFKSNAIKLIESEEKNKLLLDLAGEGIFGLDRLARFTFLNPMACSLLGAKNQDELIGKYAYETIVTKDLYRHSAIEDKLLLTQKEQMHFKSLDEKVFPIDFVSTPIYDDKEFLDGAVVVFSDSTNRKRNEDKLKQAIIDAQSASRSKSMFLANMSHELRTPLNAILGFTALLKKSLNISKDEKENLNIIHRSGKHLLNIINEILELSKIEAGKVDIKNSDFNLHQCIEEIHQLFLSRCKNKGLSFDVMVDKSVPKAIHCDELRLRQIIINLLENAIKFSDEGGVKLHLWVEKQQLYCKVSDTGMGISNEHLQTVFKAFEQIKLEKVSKSGTGLGLAITKELVEKMGGKISVESVKNEGSHFTFMVDFKKSSFAFDNTPSSNNEIKHIQEVHTKSILVVDDVKENRELLVRYLAPFGFTIYEAQNGEEALKSVEANKVDLIFMDILMPILDGLQTTKQLREKGLTLPIVIVSAHAFEEEKQKSYQSGATAYLNKPFEESELFDVLKVSLDLHYEYEQTQETENNLSLNESILSQIKDAAKALDSNAIIKLLEQHNVDEATSKIIKQHIANFDFEALKNLS